jgi:DNA polymerase V
MYALVDCNNFYVSCERVFQPHYNGKPVVVLSNNDGCVISRSNEAKKMGVTMGVPEFKIKDLIRQHQIKVFSSNYVLYGDMSQRVMKILEHYTPNVEVYSIDEAFLNFEGHTISDYHFLGTQMQERIMNWLSISNRYWICTHQSIGKNSQ